MIQLWFPVNAPVTAAVTVLTMLTILISFRLNWQAALALAVSLLAAKYSTYIDNEIIHAYAMGCCAVISIVRADGWKLSTLNARDDSSNYVLSALYVVRIIIILGMVLGLYGSPTMWELSISILVLQLLITIGSVHNGIANRINRVSFDVVNSYRPNFDGWRAHLATKKKWF